jgi:hypothetical protein
MFSNRDASAYDCHAYGVGTLHMSREPVKATARLPIPGIRISTNNAQQIQLSTTLGSLSARQ